LFHQPLDSPVLQLEDAELARVRHPAHADGTLPRAQRLAQVRLKNGVAQHDEGRLAVLENVFRHVHGVAQPFALRLLHGRHFQLRVLPPHVFDDALAPLTDNEHHLVHAHRQQPVQDVAENGFSCHVHQRLRLRVRQRPQTRPDPCDGQNRLQCASSSVRFLSRRASSTCSAWPERKATTWTPASLPASAKSPTISSTLCRATSLGKRMGASRPVSVATTAASAVMPRPKPRRRSASTSRSQPTVRAGAMSRPNVAASMTKSANWVPNAGWSVTKV